MCGVFYEIYGLLCASMLKNASIYINIHNILLNTYKFTLEE